MSYTKRKQCFNGALSFRPRKVARRSAAYVKRLKGFNDAVIFRSRKAKRVMAAGRFWISFNEAVIFRSRKVRRCKLLQSKGLGSTLRAPMHSIDTRHTFKSLKLPPTQKTSAIYTLASTHGVFDITSPLAPQRVTKTGYSRISPMRTRANNRV